MQRNRWETALRCLEIALHPGTRDDEVIAAVYGFRRTVRGIGLRDVFARTGNSGNTDGIDDFRRDERALLDRLTSENLEFRRKLEDAETDRAGLAVRVRAAERSAAEFRAAFDGVREENRDLKAMLGRPGRAVAGPPASSSAPSFKHHLAAAEQRADRAGPVAPRQPTGSGGEQRGGNPPGYSVRAGRPWTA